MAEKVTLTCDHTNNRKPCGHEARSYSMIGPEGTWTMDLCDKHSDAYTLFMRNGRLAKTHQHPGRRTVQDAARPFLEDR